MSGNNYSVFCRGCGTSNVVRGKTMTLALTCEKCKYYFRVGQWNKERTRFPHKEAPAIPIGAKGRIDKFLYEVMGFVVKQETKYKYKWREYLLFNPYRGFAFLSEYNGHWNFMWPIEHDPKHGKIDSGFDYKDQRFKLYQKYRSKVIYAEGEFFFDVVDITETTLNSEYIAPPRMLGLEASEDSLLWYEGEYLTRDEVAGAFNLPVNKLPAKTGVGYTQPVAPSFSEQSLISFTVLIVLLTILVQIILSNTSDEKVVFQADYNQSQVTDQKIIVTPAFTLEGGLKSLEIYIHAPLSNDWFFSDFSLINEETGTEYNFSKEIEHYSGYEGGEAWSEGSQYGEAFLSRIPGGRYHINIYPEFGRTRSFSISVRRDVPTTSNLFITILGLALFPIGYFIRKNFLEQKRWSESDYSPY